MSALKVTVQFAGGSSEEFVLHNGKEFRRLCYDNVDAPGSRKVRGVVRRGQVRHIELALKERKKPVEKLVLESFNNHVAPAVVAITAELPDRLLNRSCIHDIREHGAIRRRPIEYRNEG